MLRIAVTPWRRRLKTYLHPEDDLYTISPHYIDSIEATGAQANPLPWATTPESAKHRLAGYDGLVVSGGQDIDPSLYGAENTASMQVRPKADASERLLIAAAIEMRLPILAICRGMQQVNVAFGGSMHQHIWGLGPDHPNPPKSDPAAPGDAAARSQARLDRRHAVNLEPGSLIAQLFGAERIDTNSLHHQAVDAVGTDLVVTGRTDDGTVEALEHRSLPIVAVQWHPERIAGEGHHVLFDWLADTAASGS